MKKFFILTMVMAFLFVIVGCAPDTGVISDNDKPSGIFGVLSLQDDKSREDEFFG